MSKILITGGDGRFASVLRKEFSKKNIIYMSKKEFNILDINQIIKKINKIKPNIIIHLAALSRPLKIHNQKIDKSIELNIIGTANIAKICFIKNIKLIYFSTNYVYPGTKGNYKESDPVLPNNNYAWSKLGGECSVKMLKNSLIIRASMTEYPFVHKEAFSNITTSFMYHYQVAKILPEILNQTGILNIGGPNQSIYKFAIKNNPLVKKKIYKKNFLNIQKNSSINTGKLKKILNEKYL